MLNVSAQKDSIKSVVFIPFHPDIYINDASDDLCTESGKSFNQMVSYLRITVNDHMVANLKDTAQTLSLLNSFTGSENELLASLYESSNYFLTTDKNFDEEKYGHLKKSKLALKGRKEKKAKTGIKKGQLVSDVVDNYNKFLNVKFKDLRAINEVIKTHQPDRILYITQFEISGDYSDSYKVETKTFDYLVKIHYVILNRDGDFVKGGMAIETISAKEISLEKLGEETIPALAKIIADQVVSIK